VLGRAADGRSFGRPMAAASAAEARSRPAGRTLGRPGELSAGEAGQTCAHREFRPNPMPRRASRVVWQ